MHKEAMNEFFGETSIKQSKPKHAFKGTKNTENFNTNACVVK